ncbi:DUF7657 domain-containing protein [Marmoricola sp. URHA0025 HA25]
MVFVLFALAGLTTSSIGALREDPGHPAGTEIGAPLPIRADEFMTESPIGLGWIASGSRGIDNPLSVAPNFFQQLPSGPVSGVVFFDGTVAMLGPWLPDAMLFAARWWLPTLLLVIGLPIWFRQVTGTMRWGYLATVVVLFSPSNMWWSGRPVNTLGFMFAGCALLLAGHDLLTRGRTARAVGLFLASAVLMARFPSYYQPFAIILGFPVLLATLAFLWARTGALKEKAIAVLVTGGVGALLTAGTMLENLDAIKSGLGTVYPGERVSTGEAQSFGKVFGAPVLGSLEHVQGTLVNTNATEASSSFIVLFLVAGLLWLARGWRGERPARWAFVVWMAFTAIWLAWCTVDFGSIGSHLPLAKLVPAIRAANDVGFLAVIAFFLLMAQWRPEHVRRPILVIAAAVAGVVTYFAGVSWRDNGIPALTHVTILVAAAVAGAVVFLLLRWPGHWIPWVATAASVVSLTAMVNPLELGLADLRGSGTARFMIDAGKESRAGHDLWASDDPTFDALMFATATPALSSRQQVGPHDAEWLKLDPGGAHREIWNRGGSYVRFTWTQDQQIVWSNPTIDQIVMAVSPCAVARQEPRLRYVVSVRRLDDSCLRLSRKLLWSGRPHFVYEVTGSGV